MANHIYTILSISFNERSGGAENIEMYVDVDDSGTTVNLLTNQALASNATFVWNDRLVLTETDELFVKMAATTNVDVYCSYIDQQLAFYKHLYMKKQKYERMYLHQNQQQKLGFAC